VVAGLVWMEVEPRVLLVVAWVLRQVWAGEWFASDAVWAQQWQVLEWALFSLDVPEALVGVLVVAWCGAGAVQAGWWLV